MRLVFHLELEISRYYSTNSFHGHESQLNSSSITLFCLVEQNITAHTRHSWLFGIVVLGRPGSCLCFYSTIFAFPCIFPVFSLYFPFTKNESVVGCCCELREYWCVSERSEGDLLSYPSWLTMLGCLEGDFYWKPESRTSFFFFSPFPSSFQWKA